MYLRSLKQRPSESRNTEREHARYFTHFKI